MQRNSHEDTVYYYTGKSQEATDGNQQKGNDTLEGGKKYTRVCV